MKAYHNTLENAPTPTTISVNVLHTLYLGQPEDFTNGGVTGGTMSTAILVPEGAPTPNPKDYGNIPILKVVRRMIGGTVYVHAEPVTPVGKGKVGYMAGGNFVYSSDSRFRTFVCQYPIAVHDRTETVEQNQALSI